MCSVYIKKGVNMINSLTPLEYARQKADAAGNVVKTIIESDADVTPIDYARQNANDEIIKLLEEKQGKSADELYGRTVLLQALQQKNDADSIRDELERASEV